MYLKLKLLLTPKYDKILPNNVVKLVFSRKYFVTVFMCSRKLSFSEKLADSFYVAKNCQKFQKTDTHHNNNITTMQLSYNKLLLNLALDYNNTLLYHSSTVSKYINKYGSEHLHQMKLEIRKKEECLRQI